MVVTDGENNRGTTAQSVRGRSPAAAGSRKLFNFVALDIDAKAFGFLRRVRGEVLSAGDGVACGRVSTRITEEEFREAVDAATRHSKP